MNSPCHSNQQLALNTFIKLVRCTNSVCNDVHRHLHGTLSVSQFGILEALYHLGPMSQKELADKILKSAGNITTVINNLAKNGLVQRGSKDSDRRCCVIELTESGRELISSIFPDHTRIVTERIGTLSTQEQQQLGLLLKKLAMETGGKQET